MVGRSQLSLSGSHSPEQSHYITERFFTKLVFIFTITCFASLAPTFPSNMSGFLKGHSCATTSIKLTDGWKSALDEKKETGVVASDLVFDCIRHNLLLAKVKVCGVQ